MRTEPRRYVPVEALSYELARLDELLRAHLVRLRRRGRSPLGDSIGGAVVEPGEAEGILDDLLVEHRDGGPPVAPSPPPVAPALLAPLERARQQFGLSWFERDVLLLGLAVEIDSRYGRLVAFLNDHALRTRPTVGLACALLDDPRRTIDRFLPSAPLVAFGLVELDDEGPLASCSYRVAASLWPRLCRFPVETTVGELRRAGPPLDELCLAPATRERALRWLKSPVASRERALVIVRGPAGSGREALALALANARGRPLLAASVEQLGTPEQQRALLQEAVWQEAAILVCGDALPDGLLPLLERLPQPVFWATATAALGSLSAGCSRDVIEIATVAPDWVRRRALWRAHVPIASGVHDRELDHLAARFRFGPERITAAVRLAEAEASLRAGDAEQLVAADLMDASRRLPLVRFGGLAERLPAPPATQELHLTAAARRELDLALTWARNEARVMHDWGIAGVVTMGRSLTCLFSGPPGTGKTLAAQVLARELGLDLYRVDLSQVASKWIGETEKHLAALFDEAQAANVVLFFDEADSVFGRRTEVKDAHDRYANLETGFLLQRLESHEGLVILATNMKSNLDEAFVRRMQIVATFALPEPAERLRIWRAHLPAAAACAADLDLAFLADRFPLSGAEIRNAVLAASYFAAGSDESVGMVHLVRGVWRELAKSGRMLDGSLFGRFGALIDA